MDVLINHAGGGSFGPTDETTEAGFEAAYDLNVKVLFFLTAAEIAAAIAHLASPAAAFIHRVVLPVDGGRDAA